MCLTNFFASRKIKDKEYRAYVKEKEAAKLEYNSALAAGQGAAHVAYS